MEVYFLQVDALDYTNIQNIFESVYQTRYDHLLYGIRISKYSHPHN